MKKHKDIDRASALLEGTQGWIIKHIPNSSTNSNYKKTRRSRKKCVNYSSGFCKYANAICMGVDCGSYYERY